MTPKARWVIKIVLDVLSHIPDHVTVGEVKKNLRRKLES